jgi:hypothetical protein
MSCKKSHARPWRGETDSEEDEIATSVGQPDHTGAQRGAASTVADEVKKFSDEVQKFQSLC